MVAYFHSPLLFFCRLKLKLSFRVQSPNIRILNYTFLPESYHTVYIGIWLWYIFNHQILFLRNKNIFAFIIISKMVNKDPYNLYSQCHGYQWPSDATRQNIDSHDIKKFPGIFRFHKQRGEDLAISQGPILIHVHYCDLWPLLLTWFNFNPNMDKQSHAW